MKACIFCGEKTDNIKKTWECKSCGRLNDIDNILTDGKDDEFTEEREFLQGQGWDDFIKSKTE